MPCRTLLARACSFSAWMVVAISLSTRQLPGGSGGAHPVRAPTASVTVRAIASALGSQRAFFVDGRTHRFNPMPLFFAMVANALRGCGFRADTSGCRFIGKRPLRRNRWLSCCPWLFYRAALGRQFSRLIEPAQTTGRSVGQGRPASQLVRRTYTLPAVSMGPLRPAVINRRAVALIPVLVRPLACRAPISAFCSALALSDATVSAQTLFLVCFMESGG